MAQQGKQEIIKTTEKLEGGVKILERLNITSTWNKMSKTGKILLACYASAIITSFSTSTYNDGKESLMKLRLANPNSTTKEEWIAVKKGCNENTFENAWVATILPISCFTKMFPALVMWMNSKNNNGKE